MLPSLITYWGGGDRERGIQTFGPPRWEGPRLNARGNKGKRHMYQIWDATQNKEWRCSWHQVWMSFIEVGFDMEVACCKDKKRR